MPEPKTERLGVSAVEHYFSSHGWLFREQFTHDYGIDAQVEIVRDGQPTGALIGIQIKSGESYFSDQRQLLFPSATTISPHASHGTFGAL